jgi:2-C-methyl-D-erythritol 4-phosphate cytidylyltransferase
MEIITRQSQTVLITAGGAGVRMGASIPKQFLVFEGKPVLMHTIDRFYQTDPTFRLVIVLPADQQAYWKKLCHDYQFSVPHLCVDGGNNRFESVKNGLKHCPAEGLIAVHDGVRPLVSTELILRCFDRANKDGAVIPVMPVIESLRMLTDTGTVAVPRDRYCIVQTPQVFKASILKEAYQKSVHSQFTDDASVVEAIGIPVSLVNGEPTNLKITETNDLELASLYYLLSTKTD